jgi:Glycosyltransferase like family
MISIIICSANKFLLSQVKLNIEETIGVPYEIIAIDNSADKDGICSVYNRGGSKAVFPLLCFVHEDILFETKNWGLLIEQHFTNKDVGLLGFAGGDTKSIVPSSWSSSFRSNEISIIQHYKSVNAFSKRTISAEKSKPDVQKNVVALDGVFLCTRKEIFNRYQFDDVNFKGFHGYDIDYSLQILKNYSVVVVFNILVHHYSEGRPDKKWVNSAIVLSKKWKEFLPVSVYPLTDDEFNIQHWKTLQIFISHLFRLNFRFDQVIFYYLKYSFTRFFTLRRFLSMGKYVLLSLFKKTFPQNNIRFKDSFSNIAIETGHHKKRS